MSSATCSSPDSGMGSRSTSVIGSSPRLVSVAPGLRRVSADSDTRPANEDEGSSCKVYGTTRDGLLGIDRVRLLGRDTSWESCGDILARLRG